MNLHRLPAHLVLAAALLAAFPGCTSFKKTSSSQPAKTKKPASPSTVEISQVETRDDGRWYLKGAQLPFTGAVQDKHGNGLKAAEIGVVDGVRHGANIQWHDNGQKSIELPFQFGRPEGVGRQYFPGGSLQKEVMYRGGQLVGMKEYFADGKQRLLPEWNADGTPKEPRESAAPATPAVTQPGGVSATETPPAGSPGATPTTTRDSVVVAAVTAPLEVSFDKAEFRTPDGKPAVAFAPQSRLHIKGQPQAFTGRAVSFFADGRRREEMNVRDGLPHGLWIEWYPDGKQQFEFLYDTGVMKRYQAWSPDGKPISAGQGFDKPSAPLK